MPRRTPKPTELLPLKPLELSILTALGEAERYGYDIVKRISERSAGAVKLAPGNLYSVLDRLIGAGLIQETRRADEEDERRRYYGITALGRRVLAAEAARLREVLRTLDALAHPGRAR
jgi:DNA-binding PadR family transcriptional regulator